MSANLVQTLSCAALYCQYPYLIHYGCIKVLCYTVALHVEGPTTPRHRVAASVLHSPLLLGSLPLANCQSICKRL